jgi:L,D-peptidoglycan transpeptidase YkuD (ErfK/YbiS/YcfS/YnhG family)
MKTFQLILFLGIFGVFLLSGCEGPPIPQEVKQAELQELDLWRIGGPSYAPAEYQRYQSTLRKAKDDLIQERTRFFFLRDYRQVQAEFKDLLQEGEDLRARIEVEKNARTLDVENEIAVRRAKIETLRSLASTINEGYLAAKALTKAELLLAESSGLSGQGELEAASERLKRLDDYLNIAQDTLTPILARYTDQALIAKWQRLVAETVAESRRHGKLAIVVSKFDRLLYLYRAGNIVKTYPVAIGRYGSSGKLRAGDYATPEGKYSIIEKRLHSKYHKALLINYPNEEDKAAFVAAKRRGQIPRSIGIGGLVEIHGGGKDGMTYGCVALDNSQMDELFGMVDVGTPVTIVGSTEFRKQASSAVTGM